jgi:hypothetical protein
MILAVPVNTRAQDGHGPALGRTETRMLESVLGDFFIITVGAMAKVPPATEDKATVCLAVPETAMNEKAFDTSAALPPRFAAAPGNTACADFEPTATTISLWTAEANEDWRPVLSLPLDLRDRRGTAVTIEWVVESTP